MQPRQEAPEGALRRQSQDLQDAGEHRLTRHKPQVVQPGKPDVGRQHHGQHELIHAHRLGDALDGQGLLHQLLEAQPLQHGGHGQQAAVGRQVLTFEIIRRGSPDFIGL